MKKALLLSWAMACIISKASLQVSPQPLNLTGCNCSVTAIDAVSSDVIWVSTQKANFGASKVFGRSIDGGTTWTTGNIPTTILINSISATDDQNAWVSGNLPTGGGQIWHTANGGNLWVKQTSTEFTNGGYINNVHFFNSNEGVAIGDPRGGYWEFYTTQNGGSSWTRVPSANIPSQSNEAAHPNITAVGNQVWFGNNGGKIYHSADKGLTWTSKVVSNTEYIPSFADSLHGVINAPFTNKPLFVTSDGGANWSIKNPDANLYTEVLGPIVTRSGTYIFTAKSGDSLNLYYTTDNFTSAALLSDDYPFNSWLAVSGEGDAWISNYQLGSTNSIFKYESDFPLAIEEKVVSAKDDFIVFPNPAHDEIIIQLNGASDRKWHLDFCDPDGRTLYTENLSGMDSKRINIGDVPPGVYFVFVRTDHHLAQQKIIVQ
jgi:photosystem II stability/assembly factor-like uncharacterized protein